MKAGELLAAAVRLHSIELDVATWRIMEAERLEEDPAARMAGLVWEMGFALRIPPRSALRVFLNALGVGASAPHALQVVFVYALEWHAELARRSIFVT